MHVTLHHYPASLFSEKIRVLLGHLGLAWRSVEIPSIMPRPLLMPLSGGYRRTPVLQIGANVYCDTAVIARGLVRHARNESLFAPGFAAHRVAEWADSQLFRVTVALNFAPEAIGPMMSQLEPAEIEAFGKDRAALAAGGSMQTISPTAAAACLDHYLTELERSLGEPFLFGEKPSIADFSLYHCLWFLENNPVNAPRLAPFAATRAWMERMAAFGHGSVEVSDGEAALADAKREKPALPKLEAQLPPGLSLGDPAKVTPIDYGCVPVSGALVACSADEVIVEREAPEVGRVMTHFPRAGFEVAAADGSAR